MQKKLVETVVIILIAGVVIIYTLFTSTDDGTSSSCTGPDSLDPAPAVTADTKASDTPGTFATTWPNNAGFKGQWADLPYDPDAPNYLETITSYDFGWQSYWLNTSLSMDYQKQKIVPSYSDSLVIQK